MTTENTAVTTQSRQQFSLAPQNLQEAIQFADMMSKSNLVPKDFVGNTGNILVAVQWGMELGLQPMQAMQNIAVINGRPALWGDAVIALVKASPTCEYVVEEVTDSVAVCRAKRKGEPEQSRSFGLDDAKKAGLLGKSGPWTQYPKRMMQMRARSWALRDVFPDVLRGMPVAEEVMDIPAERDITPGAQQAAPKKTAAELAQEARDAAAKQAGLTPEAKAALVADLEKFSRTHAKEAFVEHWKSLHQNVRAAIGMAERDRLAGLAGSDVIDAAPADPNAPTLADAMQAVKDGDPDLARDIARDLSPEDQAKVRKAIGE